VVGNFLEIVVGRQLPANPFDEGLRAEKDLVS